MNDRISHYLICRACTMIAQSCRQEVYKIETCSFEKSRLIQKVSTLLSILWEGGLKCYGSALAEQ